MLSLDTPIPLNGSRYIRIIICRFGTFVVAACTLCPCAFELRRSFFFMICCLMELLSFALFLDACSYHVNLDASIMSFYNYWMLILSACHRPHQTSNIRRERHQASGVVKWRTGVLVFLATKLTKLMLIASNVVVFCLAYQKTSCCGDTRSLLWMAVDGFLPVLFLSQSVVLLAR